MNDAMTTGGQPASTDQPDVEAPTAEYVRCDDDGITVTRPHAFTDEQWDDFQTHFAGDQVFRVLIHRILRLSAEQQDEVLRYLDELADSGGPSR